MKVYKEIKKIAKLCAQIKHLNDVITEKYRELFEVEYAAWDNAEFVSLDKKTIQNFIKAHGSEPEHYLYDPSLGHRNGDIFGDMYFKTDVPGQYVKVYGEW